MPSQLPVVAKPIDRLRSFIEHRHVQAAIISLIVFNAFLLGLETWPPAMAAAGGLIETLDRAILAIFVIEIVARLSVYGRHFWRDPWSIFDFLVVGIALVPATGPLAVLRALRVLRVLRLVSMVPSMRRVVGALLAAIPGLGAIALVLAIIYYVFAVIATKLFAATHPDWFGSLGASFYTLFQVMTLESWSMGIARPVMDQHPLAWIFFVSFILIATFTMLNLFIAVIVNAMQGVAEQETEATTRAVDAARDHIESDLHQEMRALRQEIGALRALIPAARAADPEDPPGDTAEGEHRGPESR